MQEDDKRLLPPTRTGFFGTLLPEGSRDLCWFLRDSKEYWLAPGQNFASFKTAFERLARYETPQGRILTEKPLVCLPKFDIQYLLESFLDKLYLDAKYSKFKKNDLFSGVVRACACLHNEMDIAQTVKLPWCDPYTIFSADKLKSTVYLLLKADCPSDKLKKIEEVIIKTIKRRDRQVAKKIFKDAKNRTGDFEGVEPWPKKIITWSSGVSSVKKSETKFKQTGLFQNKTEVLLDFACALACIGTANLSFAGALAYRSVKKYKNTSKTKNISKQKNNKNNKNINKKILKNK